MLELAAVERNSLAHPDQAEASTVFLRGPALAQHLHLKRVTIATDEDLGAARPAVGERVRQRLLNDPIGREVKPGRERPLPGADVELDLQP